MVREPVESSSIRAVGYDPASRALEVEFRNGAVYLYRAVPSAVHAQFMAAPSKGRFLNARIRTAFPFSRTRGRREPAPGSDP